MARTPFIDRRCSRLAGVCVLLLTFCTIGTFKNHCFAPFFMPLSLAKNGCVKKNSDARVKGHRDVRMLAHPELPDEMKGLEYTRSQLRVIGQELLDEEKELEKTRSMLRRMGFMLEIDTPPRQYYRKMRGTDAGNKFWRQRTKEKWGWGGGTYADGEAGRFDKDDLVEAIYPDNGRWYAAQVIRYIGNGDWIVLWLEVDDLPAGSEVAQASVVKTRDMEHINVSWD